MPTFFLKKIVVLFSLITVWIPYHSYGLNKPSTQKYQQLQVEKSVKLENLIHHLKYFQQAADDNTTLPGTRFTGTPGYELSKQYIISQLKQAGYRITLQKVPMILTYIKKPRLFELLNSPARAFIDDEDFTPFVGSGEADVTTDVQLLPKTGCLKSDYQSFIPGNAVVLPAGTCDVKSKVRLAAEAGAAAVMINYTSLLYVGFTPTTMAHTPVLLITQSVMDAFTKINAAGSLPKIHIKFQGMQMATLSENILAESTTGDPKHVVIAGTHLDSSAGNAGMNDNASAVAAVLETALVLQNVKTVNQLRFAFWTGEEIGLMGSAYYLAHLNPKEKANIDYYLNFEILGAPNGARMVMDGRSPLLPNGSAKISDLFVDYFKQNNLKYFIFDPALAQAVDRSDMNAFIKAGIASGNLVSGAEILWNPLLSAIFTDLPDRVDGLPMHPCYHKACDRLTMTDTAKLDPNFDFNLYLQMSKAATKAIYTLAIDNFNKTIKSVDLNEIKLFS